jgi:hypothetical protein
MTWHQLISALVWSVISSGRPGISGIKHSLAIWWVTPFALFRSSRENGGNEKYEKKQGRTGVEIRKKRRREKKGKD